MRTILLIGLVLLSNSIANAEPNTESYKKKAFLALSAFQCAELAPNDREAEKLFTIGLKAGRDFVAFVENNTELYLKTIKSEVPMLWNLTGGPTPDFILGKIYAHMSKETYTELGADQKSWKIKKEIMFREKNCALIGEK